VFFPLLPHSSSRFFLHHVDAGADSPMSKPASRWSPSPRWTSRGDQEHQAHAVAPIPASTDHLHSQGTCDRTALAVVVQVASGWRNQQQSHKDRAQWQRNGARSYGYSRARSGNDRCVAIDDGNRGSPRIICCRYAETAVKARGRCGVRLREDRDNGSAQEA